MPTPPDSFGNLYRLFAASEPEEVRNYLARPPMVNELRGEGSTVPLLGMPLTQLPSGLLVPSQTSLQRMAQAGYKFMTAREIVGGDLPPQQMAELVYGHDRELLLWAVGALMAQLHEGHPGDRAVHEALAENLAPGPRKVAMGLLAQGDWVFLAPQALLTVAKYALLHRGSQQRPADGVTGDVMLAALGFASHLGAEPADEPFVLGTISEGIAADLFCNQLFNHSVDLGGELARWQRMRELAAEHQPQAAARFDKVFLDATGTTPQVLSDVGLVVLMRLRGNRTVAIDPMALDALQHPADQVAAAVDLLATDLDTLAAEMQAEVDAVGPNWSFNAMRRFPMFRRSDGQFVVLHPNFLAERICGSAFHWEVFNAVLSKKKVRGAYGTFMGHVAEDYVADRLAQGAPGTGVLDKTLWREHELQALWGTADRCCDLLVDGGTCWVVMDVVNHRITQDAAEGGAPADIEENLRIIVDEKAAQIEATIMRLVAAGGALPGTPVRTQAPHYHPVVVAAAGFPWNAITAAAVEARLKEKGLLRHGAIRQLSVVTLDDIEYLEAALEREATFAAVLDRRDAMGETNVALDSYLHRTTGLVRPASLKAALDASFDQLALALGLDPGEFRRDDADEDEHPDADSGGAA